jgi:hypothetical protein
LRNGSTELFRAIKGTKDTGVDDMHVPVSYSADSKADGDLSTNPNGRIPSLARALARR